ncbi:hypothetical protein NC652_019458 [Populus alba x Populus x berolinensis]|nr:hypothetical protein NC652_019458 [Populus alba x Populus x berolinensis]
MGSCFHGLESLYCFEMKWIQMVIPPPVRPPRVTQFLKPYVLKMHFTNQYVNAQVTHSPTATVASAASSQEKALRSTMENTRDVAAAAKIGKILGERLLLKDIPAVTVFLNRNQKYHGKVKAVIDSLREVVPRITGFVGMDYLGKTMENARTTPFWLHFQVLLAASEAGASLIICTRKNTNNDTIDKLQRLRITVHVRLTMLMLQMKKIVLLVGRLQEKGL